MSAKGKIRIAKLDTVGGLLREMSTVYRLMRRNEIDSLVGARLMNALSSMRRCLENSEFEQRLMELEDALTGSGATHHSPGGPRANGANHQH